MVSNCHIFPPMYRDESCSGGREQQMPKLKNSTCGVATFALNIMIIWNFNPLFLFCGSQFPYLPSVCIGMSVAAGERATIAYSWITLFVESQFALSLKFFFKNKKFPKHNYLTLRPALHTWRSATKQARARPYSDPTGRNTSATVKNRLLKDFSTNKPTLSNHCPAIFPQLTARRTKNR